VSLDPRHPDPAVIADAVHVLRGGGLVAFPTETVYGLGARALDERSVGRVFVAKGRPTHHPLIAHVEGEAQARLLAAFWPERASRLARALWPGPLTLVVDRAAHVPAAVSGGGDSIAVRAPSHAAARALVAALGEPVAAPSANRYQGLSPTTAAHVLKQLGDAADLVLDAGPCEAGIESTVVDVRGERPLVLRPGAISLATLRVLLPDVRLGAAGVTREEGRPSPGMDRRHYAPRAHLVLAPSFDDARDLARRLDAEGARTALVACGPRVPIPADGVLLRVLPGDPVEYARLLYGALHDLDDAGVAAIVVEGVPEDEAWLAVADRLRRAAGMAPAGLPA
jgi:L-threonylcarbamoyladenylate synthase